MLIGLDFGSHHSSLGLWNPETGLVQVFADDMGSRHIPCIVGFRRDEVLVGHSALVQRHKNHANTFDNIRKLLEDESSHEIYVPVLEKNLTVIELASHYFRHLSNQVKDQIGKQVKDCVMTIPLDSSEVLKSNLIEAARGGGLKIRSFVHDSVAAPLAHRLDDVGQERAVAIVVDFGWSKCEISCLEIVSGVLAPLSNNVSKSVCGASFVEALTKHCAKDFQRRAKFSCLENARSMMRLTTECESAIKILSTSAEAAIDLDSLCEGVDYAGKISRVRFEDLCLASFMSLRELVQSSIAQAIENYAQLQLGDISADSFTHIILAGGFSSVPKIQSILSTLLPNAHIMRNRIDPSEALCIGASWHGAILSQEGLFDKAMSISPTIAMPCCGYDIALSFPIATDGEDSIKKLVIVVAGTPLPIDKSLSIDQSNSPNPSSPERVLVVSYVLPQSETIVSRLGFSLPFPDKNHEVRLQISASGEVEVSVSQESRVVEKLSWGKEPK